MLYRHHLVVIFDSGGESMREQRTRLLKHLDSIRKEDDDDIFTSDAEFHAHLDEIESEIWENERRFSSVLLSRVIITYSSLAYRYLAFISLIYSSNEHAVIIVVHHNRQSVIRFPFVGWKPPVTALGERPNFSDLSGQSELSRRDMPPLPNYVWMVCVARTSISDTKSHRNTRSDCNLSVFLSVLCVIS